MPKTESTQKKVGRVRPPRVHITYDVEIGGAIEKRELPMVVGVLADLSGKPDEQLPKVADRKFIEIDRDNFDKVLAGMKPRLAYRVDNKLSGEDEKLAVELRFNGMEDFEPDNLAQQIEPLRKLVEVRRHLHDLLLKTDGNENLEGLLNEILRDDGAQKQLSESLNLGDASSTEPKEESNE